MRSSFESYAAIIGILLNNDIWVPISPNWKYAQIRNCKFIKT